MSLSLVDQGDKAGPALVLLPGPTDSWRSYQPVLDRLPPAIRAIAVSQRGHGDSDKPPDGYRVQDFAADVIDLLDALHVERAVLAGHSGSCLVARRVALDQPERVAGLVLEASPTTLHDDPRLQDFVTSIVSNLEDPIGADFARSIVLGTSSEDLPAPLVDDLVAELRKVPARVWKAMFAGLLEYDDTSELSRIQAPTLLLWGDADALVPRDMQDQLLSRIPGAELTVYANAGHTPRWDDPSRFSADTSAFVQALATPH
jgi:pimeloyl-ACP methyl ester carboxylesterase